MMSVCHKLTLRGVLSTALAVGVLCWLAPSLTDRGVDLSFELTASNRIPVRVLYTQTGPYSGREIVTKSASAGTTRLHFFLPVETLHKCRIDFGSQVGVFSVSRVQVDGMTHAICRWTGDEATVGFSEWTADAEGRVTGKPSGKGAFAYVVLAAGEVAARTRIDWAAVALILSACLFLWRKLMHGISSFASPVDSDGRVFAYDILRVIALVLVIVSHVVMQDRTPGWFDAVGLYGLSIYIILSGAGLALGRGNSGALDFLRRRMSAILPTYWTCYLLAGVLVLIISGQVKWGGDYFMWLQTICGFDGFLRSRYPANYYLIGEWYIGCALLLYVMAYFVLKACRRFPVSFFVVAVLLSVGGYWSTPALSRACLLWHSNPWWNPVVRLPEFTFGALFSLFIVSDRKRLLWVAGCAAPVFLYCFAFRDELLFSQSYWNMAGCAASFATVCACTCFFRFGDGFRSAVGFLSKYSFGTYLFHHRLIWWIIDACPYKAHFSRDAYVVLVVMATLVLGYLLSWLIARPAALVKAFVFERGRMS